MTDEGNWLIEIGHIEPMPQVSLKNNKRKKKKKEKKKKKNNRKQTKTKAPQLKFELMNLWFRGKHSIHPMNIFVQLF